MQNSDGWRRPAAQKKIIEERSVWIFFFPFLSVFLPLFFSGHKSLVISVPLGLLCFWRLDRTSVSATGLAFEGLAWVGAILLATHWL